MMNYIFRNFIAKEIMTVYLDYILIFTWTLKDYHKEVCRILKVLAKHWLYLYLEKYEFDKQ